MSTCLIAIDPQYDYLPGGSLEIPGAENVIRNLAAQAHIADLVIVTRDWHPENHFSFTNDPEYKDGSWPAHCVQNTKGARIFPALRRKAAYVISKGTNKNPPDDYSAFTGKTLRPVERLDEILARHKPEQIWIGGFVLEICVQHTAFDANILSSEWTVSVLRPCTATMGLEDADKILDHFERVGIQVLNP